jgi:NADP-dependent aldehyde dehydrogenase
MHGDGTTDWWLQRHAADERVPMSDQSILVAGGWRPAAAVDSYRALNPSTGAPHPAVWPVSGWSDVDAALDAAVAAAHDLAVLPPARIASFLEGYAARLEACGGDLVDAAHAETGLPRSPRLADVELPRMLDQLRQAAAAARAETWRMPMIDRAKNIRSAAFGLGPIVVLPPANFPLAFGAITGGDFAAAIAAGNPVIAKAHRGHPGVSMVAARHVREAVREAGLPPATVQLLHGIGRGDGERLVADPRVGGSAFTGSEAAGRRLFAAAATAGKVMWVEMGSLNPAVLLPHALAERGDEIAAELTTSVTGSAGQLCTKPGIVFLIDDAAGGHFVSAAVSRFKAVGPQVLLTASGRGQLDEAVALLAQAGARLLVDGPAAAGPCCRSPSLLDVTATAFCAAPQAFLVEAFGNATLLVRCGSLDELCRAVAHVQGTLAASLYAAGGDAEAARAVRPLLVARAGRLVENRMPTGLAVTAPMQHGGPWPSAGPPFFSAVGMPWTLLRFARRICFDNCPHDALPPCLHDAPPAGSPWRFIDGNWLQA